MTLDTYLSRNRGELERLAGALAKDPSTLWRWRRGRSFPRPEDIREIEYLTDGAVTPADWYGSQQSRG